MKPRQFYPRETSAARIGTHRQPHPTNLKNSRVSGNWLDMLCGTSVAPRGLTAQKNETAMSLISETVGVCLTLKEAAARLHVCRRTLEREIAAGRFPRPLKIGRSVRVPESDLVAYLASLRTTVLTGGSS